MHRAITLDPYVKMSEDCPDEEVAASLRLNSFGEVQEKVPQDGFKSIASLGSSVSSSSVALHTREADTGRPQPLHPREPTVTKKGPGPHVRELTSHTEATAVHSFGDDAPASSVQVHTGSPQSLIAQPTESNPVDMSGTTIHSVIQSRGAIITNPTLIWQLLLPRYQETTHLQGNIRTCDQEQLAVQVAKAVVASVYHHNPSLSPRDSPETTTMTASYLTHNSQTIPMLQHSRASRLCQLSASLEYAMETMAQQSAQTGIYQAQSRAQLNLAAKMSYPKAPTGRSCAGPETFMLLAHPGRALWSREIRSTRLAQKLISAPPA
eukprot:gene3513-3968_t